MKRKKLTDFINWFANSRRHYNQSDSCMCIASHALHFFGPKGNPNRHRDADSFALMEAFDLTLHQSTYLYTSAFAHYASRPVAVEVMRFMLKTGRVNWPRAKDVVAKRTGREPVSAWKP